MESLELPQMDPRVLKATSVKAEDPAASSPEPHALKITAASSNPKMFTLPWEKPLATWPEDLLANLPRGISRHVVRFVHVGDWKCQKLLLGMVKESMSILCLLVIWKLQSLMKSSEYS